MNNDIIAQRIADAVLTNALARLASTYGLRLVPASDVTDFERASADPIYSSETDAPHEPSSDTLPSSPETSQPPQSNP